MSGKKILVVSVDAMIGQDIEVLRSFPECAAFFRDYAQAEEVWSIYPSLTYPCHASILTGCRPMRHGIINNDKFEPGNRNPEWFWYASYLKVPSIFDVAHRAGLKTASVAWPVTAGADVDYLVAKVYAPDTYDDSLFNSLLGQKVYEKHKDLRGSFSYREVDGYATACTVDILENYKPDLTLSYLMTIDHMRHKKGVDTSLHVEALHFVAENLGKMVEATKRAGTFDDTVFILVSDHGQINVDKVFNINVVLKDMGYIKCSEEGVIEDWSIFSRSCAFSGQIYSRGISEEETRKILEEIQRRYPGTIERIRTRKECEEEYGTSGDYLFMVESVTGVSIGSDFNGPAIVSPDNKDYHVSTATHGYAPEKGPKATFVLSGPGVRKGARVKSATLMDEAPTILALLGVEMPDVDGIVLSDLLEEQ